MNNFIKYRTILFWLFLVSLHSMLLTLAIFTSVLSNTPLEGFGITALLIPYLLQRAGLPTLEGGGLSGMGLPSPNILGWFLSMLFWLAFYWLIAKTIRRNDQK